jgi:hypothetical protein
MLKIGKILHKVYLFRFQESIGLINIYELIFNQDITNLLTIAL